MVTVANFDGLIGSTHNYAGLSFGNLASFSNTGLLSNPQAAALQGLEKMKKMVDLGLFQGVLPPHQRPYLPLVRDLGFYGNDREIFVSAWKQSPNLMINCFSASPMWAANSATVSPSFDCADKQLHLTVANMSEMFHRSIESNQTYKSLKRAFPFAKVHKALFGHSFLADEGAANHVRLCGEKSKKGIELFVYGREGYIKSNSAYPARQTYQASQTIMRNHRLDTSRTVYAKQSKIAIDAGAFHNDVVCVGAMNTLFYHEFAFENSAKLQSDIRKAANGIFEPIFIEVKESVIPLQDAIESYLFNSMLVKIPDSKNLTLIAPLEVKKNVRVARFCENLVAENNAINEIYYVDVRQSMRNGGGPACLRLAVPLDSEEKKLVNNKNILTENLYSDLKVWINKHYREEISPNDLRDVNLMYESFSALDELTNIMQLGSDFYSFQK